MEQFNRYFVDTLKNRYAKFDGRARRSEYWYFILFYMIGLFILVLLDTFVLNPILGATPQEAGQGGILQMVFALALLVPSLALSIRRLHDIGKSGWWMLIVFIPLLGALVLLYFHILDSEAGENRFGANPKE